MASCDSYGVVKLWDVRAVAPMVSFEVGPHPANKVAFDPTGRLSMCCTVYDRSPFYSIYAAYTRDSQVPIGRICWPCTHS